MRKTTLIVGAGSRLGRILRRIWADAPDVRWLSRSGPDGGWTAVQGAEGLRGYMDDVDVVVCLAGATPGAADFDLNPAVAEAVLTAAGPTRHVFLASTMAVYGGGAGPHSESGPVAPVGGYGLSKLEMEHVAAAKGTPLTILRLGNVVGADMLFDNISAGRAITLDRFADGRSPVRSYLDPERLAAALQALVGMVRDGQAVPGLLNLASEPALEMAALARAAGVAFDTRDAPDTARPHIAMDLSRARRMLPVFNEPVSAEDAVAAWRRVEALA